ncbi:MAG: type II toxin-antitoxin system VapC family toxin [Acidobacteria bacterium]|nr:type II toxin-antitoxin system VapC family toxin [Acidobacteriota bacterium]
MRVCLDTSAYSAFRRGLPAAVEALQLAAEVVFTPVIVGELLCGFRGGNRYASNRSDLQEFLRSPRVLMVSIDEETALRYSEIYSYLRGKGAPIPTNDVWIAATAMQYGLEVLTTDRHFERIPQVLSRLLLE